MEPGEDRFPTVEEIDAWLELTGCDKLILEEGMLYKASPGVTIDLSAIAKGYGSDIACNYLVDAGFENVFVEVGGEIMVNGKNIHSEGWRIGVDRPQLASTPGESLQHILAVSDYGVATSGDYRNYREVEGRRITHTIDPRTGYPIEHSLASATVISTTCMDADGYATAAMVMGLTEGLVWLEELENVEGLLITRSDDGGFSEHMTTGFAAYIVE